ncbi:DNA-3-methyladenine glycosylase I [Desulfovibrio ferrophilus]|uniref:DNA-3-methyladenine glycosylase I n=1 Tax=Desulfovibrio ferrophilus TaxID=241368 RepID=A0A2Z6B371_9BACT|nr:DNA-3-methyladenine glycosylase I [Desulfovibrio ferrophilus]BBD09895.1 DNA-3-methyladenine glycosylase I [Desulfovibrio ferrophilus]
MPQRCNWALSPDEMTRYHDEEWGIPEHDDTKHFEFLILESAQAGLSWLTILRRREGYRQAFAGFDPILVAQFTDADEERLMNDAGIIRNRAKIKAAINNAARFQEIQAEFGSFDAYIWDFVNGRPIQNTWSAMDQLPATTPASDALSKDLKRRGFKFVGPTTIYAHMQATGLVNDHLTSCFRYEIIRSLG